MYRAEAVRTARRTNRCPDAKALLGPIRNTYCIVLSGKYEVDLSHLRLRSFTNVPSLSASRRRRRDSPGEIHES